MPNLEKERADLLLADQHISKQRSTVADMEARLSHSRGLGLDVTQQELALNVGTELLKQFQAHRELIIATMAGIQTGKLPST